MLCLASPTTNSRPGSGRSVAQSAALPSGVGGDPHGQLELDGVGVLELVEQDPGVALVDRRGARGVVGEQLAGEHEQVVELQPAGGAPLVDGVEREPAQQRAERQPALLVEVGEPLVASAASACSAARSASSAPSGARGPLPVRPCCPSVPGLISPSSVRTSSTSPSDGSSASRRPSCGDAGDQALLAVAGGHVDRGDRRRTAATRSATCGSTGAGRSARRAHHQVPVVLEVLRHPPCAAVEAEPVVLAQVDEADLRGIVQQAPRRSRRSAPRRRSRSAPRRAPRSAAATPTPPGTRPAAGGRTRARCRSGHGRGRPGRWPPVPAVRPTPPAAARRARRAGGGAARRRPSR